MPDFLTHQFGTDGMKGRTVVSMPPDYATFIAGWIEAMAAGRFPILEDFALNLMNARPHQGAPDA